MLPNESDASPLATYDQVATAMTRLVKTDDAAALRLVCEWSGHQRTFADARRQILEAIGESAASDIPTGLTLDQARVVVARAHDFPTWTALSAAVARNGSAVLRSAVRISEADREADEETAHTWDDVLNRLPTYAAPALHAGGQMTDQVLASVARLNVVTRLDLEGCRQLSSKGLRALAGASRLRHLSLSGCRGLDDEALQVLKDLPHLESLSLSWTTVTDAGLRHLRHCTRLRWLDLMGTPSGDEAIRALSGHPELRHLRTGDLVTPDGLSALHQLPRLVHWSDEDIVMALCDFSSAPTHLVLRGGFGDDDLERLVGLDGLFGLNIDDARLGLTAAAIRPLHRLERLGWLAFDADDSAMRDIGGLPHLRFLMCQDTRATDDGFVALSRSPSIEYIWGRRCHGLQRRGFEALSTMPALRALSVSCLNVEDAGLAALPQFPSLTELMPIDVPDTGYRHIGRCERLEALVLMYCRDTGDVATAAIRSLPRLRTYFASYTRITDDTPRMLSESGSLEQVTLDACRSLTTNGIAALAAAPRLRRLDVAGMPRVDPDVITRFPAAVRVRYRV